MNGIHDLGGMHGFGPVVREADEPVFHEEWQETAFALMLAASMIGKGINADQYRHAVERMAPRHYLAAHYYERVLTAVTTLLVERGVLDRADLERRAGGPFPLALPVAAEPLAELAPQPEPRFAVGQQVRVRKFDPKGHTRAPGFCRGKLGTVLHVAPKFPFPDASAHNGELRDEHTYHIEFAARELWGSAGGESDSVVVDLWDSYLEGAGR
jgi:nitrile hydratase beta subunit